MVTKPKNCFAVTHVLRERYAVRHGFQPLRQSPDQIPDVSGTAVAAQSRRRPAHRSFFARRNVASGGCTGKQRP